MSKMANSDRTHLGIARLKMNQAPFASDQVPAATISDRIRVDVQLS